MKGGNEENDNKENDQKSDAAKANVIERTGKKIRKAASTFEHTAAGQAIDKTEEHAKNLKDVGVEAVEGKLGKGILDELFKEDTPLDERLFDTTGQVLSTAATGSGLAFGILGFIVPIPGSVAALSLGPDVVTLISDAMEKEKITREIHHLDEKHITANQVTYDVDSIIALRDRLNESKHKKKDSSVSSTIKHLVAKSPENKIIDDCEAENKEIEKHLEPLYQYLEKNWKLNNAIQNSFWNIPEDLSLKSLEERRDLLHAQIRNTPKNEENQGYLLTLKKIEEYYNQYIDNKRDIVRLESVTKSDLDKIKHFGFAESKDLTAYFDEPREIFRNLYEYRDLIVKDSTISAAQRYEYSKIVNGLIEKMAKGEPLGTDLVLIKPYLEQRIEQFNKDANEHIGLGTTVSNVGAYSIENIPRRTSLLDVNDLLVSHVLPYEIAKAQFHNKEYRKNIPDDLIKRVEACHTNNMNVYSRDLPINVKDRIMKISDEMEYTHADLDYIKHGMLHHALNMNQEGQLNSQDADLAKLIGESAANREDMKDLIKFYTDPRVVFDRFADIRNTILDANDLNTEQKNQLISYLDQEIRKFIQSPDIFLNPAEIKTLHKNYSAEHANEEPKDKKVENLVALATTATHKLEERPPPDERENRHNFFVMLKDINPKLQKNVDELLDSIDTMDSSHDKFYANAVSQEPKQGEPPLSQPASINKMFQNAKDIGGSEEEITKLQKSIEMHRATGLAQHAQFSVLKATHEYQKPEPVAENVLPDIAAHQGNLAPPVEPTEVAPEPTEVGPEAAKKKSAKDKIADFIVKQTMGEQAVERSEMSSEAAKEYREAVELLRKEYKESADPVHDIVNDVFERVSKERELEDVEVSTFIHTMQTMVDVASLAPVVAPAGFGVNKVLDLTELAMKAQTTLKQKQEENVVDHFKDTKAAVSGATKARKNGEAYMRNNSFLKQLA